MGSNGSDESNSSESRLVAALCYVFILVVPVLVLASDLRRQRFLRYHAYQGLGAGMLLLVLYLLVLPGATWLLLHIPCVGWSFACLAPFIYLTGLALQLYWAYLAYQGHVFSIPILGNLASSYMGE
ncbi:MAG: DUF4870 domain-containing protein [Chloroflexota bacterium]